MAPVLVPALRGVDFTSRPSRRKPIVMALGHPGPDGQRVFLTQIVRFETASAFAAALNDPGPWVGGFDLPFGLPRDLVAHLGWPTDWLACMRHYAALERPAIRALFAAFCAARPVGGKFAHRACDGPAGSSPSMKWVNPPVAWMLHAGIPALLAAGVHLPALHVGDRSRVALEAYPGLLAHELIGHTSYKSDEPARHTPERQAARQRLLDRLAAGDTRLSLRIELSAELRQQLIEDASGDALDATLCLVQAAWAARQPDFGLPAGVDPLEGWIITAPHAPAGHAAAG